MKKLPSFFVLSAIIITLLLPARDMAQISDLTQKYFPNAQVKWSNTFQGSLADLAISRKSGHVAVATVSDEALVGTVYYFSPNGVLLWKIDNLSNTKIQKIGAMDLEIVDDGSMLKIVWSGDWESAVVQVCDSTGESMFKREGGLGLEADWQISTNGRYIASSNGLYFLKDMQHNISIQGFENGWKYSYIAFSDNIAGVVVSEDVRNIEKSFLKGRMKTRRGREIIRVKPIKQFLHLYHLDKRTSINQYDISPGALVTTFINKDNVLMNIIRSVPEDLSERTYSLKLFDIKGNEIWTKHNFFNHDYFKSFMGNEKIVLYGANEILIIDKDGYEKSRFKLTKQETVTRTFSLFIADKYMFISGYRDMYEPNSFHIREFQNWSFVSKLDNKGNVLENQIEKGLVFGSTEKGTIVVYQSDSEHYDKENEKYVIDDFRIEVIKP